nr:hypothetical protein [Enterovibrio nigricans]
MHSVKRGDYVSANQMLSNFVGETTDIWVEFSVPQFYPQLEVGSQVRVRNIDALGRSTFQLANVIAKDTQISSSTRSLKYRAALSQHIANYTSNTPLEVLIPISANKHVFKVPSTSVNQDLYGAYVVKLVEQDDDSGSFRAERLSVAVIAEKENVKFISHGVYQGEAIAAAGAFKLYEGILVRVRENRLVPEEAEIALAGGE